MKLSIFDLEKKEFIKNDKPFVSDSEIVQLLCSYLEFIIGYPSNYAATSLTHNIIFYAVTHDFIAELYNEQNRDKA